MAPRSRSTKRRRFEPGSVTRALSDMIIVNELPFSVVEEGEFADRMEAVFPGFHMPSSETISRVCVQYFMDEKLKLKSFIKSTNQSVCLSLDTWMSKQSVNYLCITAHFIDNDWNLHKRIIGFSPIGGDNGVEIGLVVEKCLHDWGINNVLAVSAGNETSNDAAVLKDNDKWIVRVRAAVSYMLRSPSRIKKFEDFGRQHRIQSDSCLFLDSPTIWLSTFDMLDTCQKFEDVFNWFDEKDLMYKKMLHKTCGSPVCIDWEKVRKAVCCLTGLFWLTGEKKLDPNVSGDI
ncbi:zinc finger BED domain-containing protein DAYSLEEPER-like [Bidens hawaiensis]|uniref:zinc finger BED domain-containing protein DAYSLEEPER-like n=1 Tax=Bidens hawaiensis TaxID=980011 RepID=UPI00404A468F